MLNASERSSELSGGSPYLVLERFGRAGSWDLEQNGRVGLIVRRGQKEGLDYGTVISAPFTAPTLLVLVLGSTQEFGSRNLVGLRQLLEATGDWRVWCHYGGEPSGAANWHKTEWDAWSGLDKELKDIIHRKNGNAAPLPFSVGALSRFPWSKCLAQVQSLSCSYNVGNDTLIIERLNNAWAWAEKDLSGRLRDELKSELVPAITLARMLKSGFDNLNNREPHIQVDWLVGQGDEEGEIASTDFDRCLAKIEARQEEFINNGFGQVLVKIRTIREQIGRLRNENRDDLLSGGEKEVLERLREALRRLSEAFQLKNSSD